MPVDPFPFDPPSSLPSRAAAYVARPLLSRLATVDGLLTIYREARQGPPDGFGDRVLSALNISIAADREMLDLIPASGPAIITANHPHGALDGLALLSVVRQVRRDVRLLANRLLSIVPELRPCCCFVDPFGGAAAVRRSLGGLREAHLLLRRGGAIVMLPAGEEAPRLAGDGVPVERAWLRTAARLAAATGAALIPAHIDGANSAGFYRAGRLHPLLRTALLPSEFLHKRNARVRVSFAPALKPAADPGGLTVTAQQASVALGRTTDSYETEIATLPPEALLVDANRYGVYLARACEIPRTLGEIGRLRAIAFRAAGEGTGADVDLDAFDSEYLHLFAWDRVEQRIVGAYRLGVVSDIVRRRGVTGLYTRTLFDYGPKLLEALGPAVELGRSFVSPEYQRNHQALLLLWRGIGAFVSRNPEHRVLFGPVSISARYSDASHALLTAFLERNHLDPALARLVTPRHPRPRMSAHARAVPDDTDQADRQIRQIEGDGKPMPVLLRHYLKLHARALGFSVDPGFGHVLDALMAVNLTEVPPNILRRYLGAQVA
jgi:putative hemolysin